MDRTLNDPLQFQELHLQLQDLHIKLKKSLQIGKQDHKECLQVLGMLGRFHLPTSMDVNHLGLVDSIARSHLRKSRRLGNRRGEGQDERPEDYLFADRKVFCIKVLPDKGRAVFTRQDLKKGEFLLNYRGELIDKAEGEQREETEETGFRYFSEFKGRAFCIDATAELTRVEDSLGRLVNHGKGKETNCRMKVSAIDGQPRLCLYATKDIKSDTELLYDYGLPANFKFPPPYHVKAIQESLLTSSAISLLQEDNESKRSKQSSESAQDKDVDVDAVQESLLTSSAISLLQEDNESKRSKQSSESAQDKARASSPL